MRTANLHLFIYMAMLIAHSALSASCASRKEAAVVAPPLVQPAFSGVGSPAPKAIVYRTTKDYSDFVPVMMNASRTAIVSYPAPSDLGEEGRQVLPIALRDGFLLDRRGIGENVAFTDYTYSAYSKLEKTPSAADLMAHIVDRHPLVAMYALPFSVAEAVADTARCNKLIADGFKGCRTIVAAPPVPSRQ